MKDGDYILEKGQWQRAEQQAAQWLAKWDSAEPASAALLQGEFEAWLAADPVHRAAYARMAGIIEQAAQVQDFGHLASVNGEAGTLASSLSRFIAPRRAFLRRAAWGMAAMALGGGGFAVQALAWSTQSSGLGENLPVALPDGCMARLNTNSQVSWRFRASKREIWLERGEMALVVAPGVTCGLHVPTGLLRLQTGRFNLRLRDEALSLLVLNGRAEFLAQAQVKSVAQAGQSMVLAPDGPVLRSSSEHEIANSLAWQNGEILFQNDSLATAVEEYNRYLPRKILLVDRDLANILVGGRFTTTDPQDFLDSLQLGLSLRVMPQEENILVMR